jgi:hypothetical protein
LSIKQDLQTRSRKKPPSPSPQKPPEPGKPFDPIVLDKTVIAIPLLEKIRQENEGKAERVIYNCNN